MPSDAPQLADISTLAAPPSGGLFYAIYTGATVILGVHLMSLFVLSVVASIPLVLHPILNLDEHGEPLVHSITGIVCASPHDIAGAYAFNESHSLRTIEELLASLTQANYACQILMKEDVEVWGPVIGPAGKIETKDGKGKRIVEISTKKGGVEDYLYIIAK
jgi:hypothetical protein